MFQYLRKRLLRYLLDSYSIDDYLKVQRNAAAEYHQTLRANDWYESLPPEEKRSLEISALM